MRDKEAANNCLSTNKGFTGNAHQLGEQKVELLLVTRKGRSHLVKVLDGEPAKLR